jgi:hypothetical protein
MSTGQSLRPGPCVDEAPFWLAVDAERVCPVCGATEGCGVAPDDGLALCRAVVSALPVVGGGWLHDLVPAGTRAWPAPAGRRGAAGSMVLGSRP